MGEIFMKEAIALAMKGKGHTAPNPPVGSVVVDSKGQIIGRGFHPKAGEPHAEVFAITDALKNQKDISDCTLYVTLEPCNHHGRTPPCLDLILKHGFKKVVVGSIDPNPQMAGSSLEKLRQNGVEVISGVLGEDCDKLIRGFKSVMQTQKPFVVLKSAVSLDGKIATQEGESKWITSPESRKYVHQLRSESDAVLVGSGTVLKDDPRLDARDFDENKILKKIILDSRLQTPLDAQVFKTAGEVIIYCDQNYSSEKRKTLEKNGATVVPVGQKNSNLNLEEVLKDLPLRGVQEVFVEGGAHVLGSFLQEKLFDKLVYFIAPKIIGEQGRSVFAGFNAPSLADSVQFTSMKMKNIGPDFVFEGEPCSQV